MTDPIKVTGKDAEGAEHTITLEGPPTGLIAESEFETRFNDRFKTRATSLQKTARTEALADEDFKGTALKAWGIDPDAKLGDGEPTAERIAALETQWTDRHVKPLREQLDVAEGRNKQLLGTRLRAEILAEAERVGVKKQFREKTEGMGQAMIVASTLNLFEYDPDTDDFYVKGQKSGEFEYTTRAAADRKSPYRTIGEHFDLFGENKNNSDFLEDTRQRGPSHKGGDRRSSDVIISRADAKDHQKYVAAEKLAEEQGGQLLIED